MMLAPGSQHFDGSKQCRLWCLGHFEQTRTMPTGIYTAREFSLIRIAILSMEGVGERSLIPFHPLSGFHLETFENGRGRLAIFADSFDLCCRSQPPKQDL